MTHQPDYERDMMVGARHPRAWRWGFAIGVLLLAGALLALVIPNFDRRSTTPSSRGDEFGDTADAAGGMDDPRSGAGTGGELGGGPAQAPAGSAVMDIATITEARDLSHLVGRTVSFRVEARDLASDVAFWVGAEGERLLVVPDRDTRSGLDRQVGRPPRHDPMRVARGEGAIVKGVIERIPYAETTYSWNLSREDVAELAKRDVYVRAVSIAPAAQSQSPPRP